MLGNGTYSKVFFPRIIALLVKAHMVHRDITHRNAMLVVNAHWTGASTGEYTPRRIASRDHLLLAQIDIDISTTYLLARERMGGIWLAFALIQEFHFQCGNAATRFVDT